MVTAAAKAHQDSTKIGQLSPRLRQGAAEPSRVGSTSSQTVHLNSAAAVSAGVGISLNPGDVSAPAIRDAAARLLGDPTYRDAAARVGRSIAAMPTADEVAAVIEELPHLAVSGSSGGPVPRL